MRLAPFGLALSLTALPLVAQVERLSQSSVTLSLTSSRTGEAGDAVKLSNNDYRISTPLDTVGLGNRQLLEVMRQGALLDDTSVAPPVAATSIKGWTLVAVWAAWDGASADSSYRFFARKKTGSTTRVVAVPESLLTLDFLTPYVRKSVKLNAESEPVSGTYLYKTYAEVSVGEDDRYFAENEDDDQENDIRLGLASTTNGVLVSSGRYARPRGTESAIFLPGRATFTGYGQTDADEDSIRDFVALGLRIGASNSVKVTDYAAFFDATTGANSRGPETVAEEEPETLSSGTLTLGGSTGTPGGTIIGGLIVSPPPTGGGTTITLGAAM